MKKYILTTLMLLSVVCVAAQQKEYSGKMHVTPLMLEQRGDSLYIKLIFDITGVNVDSRRSISLVPSLVAPGKKLDLPEVQVKGRNSYNVYKREMSLMSKYQAAHYKVPYAVVKGYNANDPKRIEYSKVIKYEPWMAQSKLDMYEDLCGCGNPARRMGVSQLINQAQLEKLLIIEPYIVVPYLAYIQPPQESVKRREMIQEAYVDFVVGKTDIRPEYMNNPQELRKITDMINTVKNDPDVQVNAIEVTGYASPEGTTALNESLSRGRANSLVNYLAPEFDYPRSLYKVVYGGENWDGLKTLVEASNLSFKNAVLNILESVPAQINTTTNTSRKKSLMNLQGGNPYRIMLKEFFPQLRKAVCKVDYTIKSYDMNAAREMIKVRPQNLSLSEMFAVAASYENGSPEFVDVFETAVRMYPDNQTAIMNAASASLARKDIYSAERYLSKVKSENQDARYNNAMGVLLMLKEDYAGAEQYLRKASAAGVKEAQQNLDEIVKKRDNIAQIETSKK